MQVLESGNRTNQQRVDGTAESYGYDATDQLTAATYNTQAIGQPNRNVNYTYDAVGNRQQVADNGNSTAYTTNPLNQYTLVGGSSLAYDANGNLTGGNGWTYTYDAQNRITSAQRSGTHMTFSYDPLNR